MPPKEFSWSQLIKAFWYFLGKYRARLLFWIVILIICYSYEFIPIFVLGKIVDYFIKTPLPQVSLRYLYLLIGILGAGTFFVSLIRLSAKKYVGNIRAEVKYNIRVNGYQRLLNYSLKWHDQENSGNKIQRINTGSNAMRDFISLASKELLQLVAYIIGTLLIFLFIDWKYFLFLCVYLIFFWIIQKIFYQRIVAINQDINRTQEESSGSYQEGLSNILAIKSLGVGNSFKQKIFAVEETNKSSWIKSVTLGTNKWNLLQFVNTIALCIFLFLVVNDVTVKIISIGQILVFWNYFNKLVNSAGDATNYFDQFVETKEGIARMMPIFNDDLEQEAFGKHKFPSNWQKIRFIDSSFSYQTETRTLQLKKINLELTKFQKIGIAGASGSGKSTFAKLLLRLYPLNSGQICFDELNLNKIDHTALTNNITVVIQESELFNLSLLENITLLQKLSGERLQKALQISQLEELVSKLPDGLNTLIGEKGYRLSGGERQRIGIARAIYRNAPIIIFDEATSHLDVKTEEMIQNSLESELKGNTLITIAHRVSTLKNSDIIYVFKNGSVVEQGTFHDLITNPKSEFYRLNYTAGGRRD
ncbi:MAG: ABC transporter ATP-binding protein [bacterium]